LFQNLKGRSIGVDERIMLKLIEKKSAVWDVDWNLQSQSRAKLQAVVNTARNIQAGNFAR
jgi:hypothetical protein